MANTTTIESLRFGEPAPDFKELGGTDGIRYGFSSFEDRPVLVLVFISNGCPTVTVYEDRLIEIQRSYGDKGVQILAVNSNNPYLSPPDVYAEMVSRAEKGRFNFPYVKDQEGSVARAYGAISTPHAFVLDAGRRLRYRGRIDDSRDISNITSRDLENAIVEVLEGRDVLVPETQPFGCAIVR